MCLGDIGTIRDIWVDGGIRMASIDRDDGVRTTTCLMYVPEAVVGDEVIVHLNFAVDILPKAFSAESRQMRSEARRTIDG